MTEIDLSHNNLTSFPDREKLPDRLRYLDVSDNPLSSIPFGSFRNLSSLEHLDLARSKTEFVFAEGSFANLKKLRYLDMKYPDVSNTSYPDKALSQLSALETLRVSGKTQGFSSAFLKLTRLKTLDISGTGGYCSLRYIPTDFFRKVPNITILDISNCNLKNLLEGTFSNLRFLLDLNISLNQELSFAIMENLTKDLSSTNIERLRLQQIHCFFGRATQILRKDTYYLKNTKLKEIYVDQNRLQFIESGVLANLPKSLEYASVAGNRLTFDWYALEVWFMKNIRIFDMSNLYPSIDPVVLFRLCDDTRNKRKYESTGSHYDVTERS